MLKSKRSKILFPPSVVARPVGRIRVIVCGVAVVALLGGLLGAHMLPASLFIHAESLLASLHRLGFIGMMLFGTILIAIALSGFIPGSLIGIFAGTVYGLSIGFVISAVSTLLGALLAFLLARSLLRPLLAKLLATRARLQGFDAAIARDGWRFVCLLRISPVMPFAVTSYALGASSVTMKNYMLGTLGALPALLGYVIIGTLAKASFSAATQGTDIIRWFVIGAGLAATMFLTWRIGRLAASVGLVSHTFFGGNVYAAEVRTKGD